MTTRSPLQALLVGAALLLLIGKVAPLGAQEGFPLDGTWRAQLGDRTVVVIMRWNGEQITGMINPGPRSIQFSSAVLEPSDWGVRIEAVNADGNPIVLVGTLTDIGSYNRTIVGTWSENGESLAVRLRRE